MATLPMGAMPEDLGEFMLGRIAVTPVLLESNGAIDTNQLDWTAQGKADVLQNLRDGLAWWKDLLATKSQLMSIDWVIDTTYLDNPLASSYEPISRVSNDYTRWVPEALAGLGQANASDIDSGIRSFNQSQRSKYDTDWSFTIFIVNSARDQLFASGGSFSRAFAFAGGLYFVTPSNRPASTYAHETGHMFWARDEYAGGGNYLQHRGYYDSQNLNAVDLNPDPNFVQQTSIMSSDSMLNAAFTSHTTADATLAQIGWQDSDNDGIFDVLDVPLDLNGVGRYDSATQTYKFSGNAKAKALPNVNTSGLQDDITLNRIGRIEYRFAGQNNWTTASTPNVSSTSINLSIPVPSGQTGTIELRAIEPRWGITSNVFIGAVRGIDSTSSSGISGFVWADSINDGVIQSSEKGLKGLVIDVVNNAGLAISLQKSIEPDDHSNGVVTSNAYPGATLTAFGLDTDGRFAVGVNVVASTGTKAFLPYSPILQGYRTGWRDEDQQLRVTPDTFQSTFSVDVLGVDATNYGRLEVYASDGTLLERVTSDAISQGQFRTLTINRPSADISYAVIKGHLGTRIGIDNIRFGSPLRTTTGETGEFELPGLPIGSYRVRVTPSSGYTTTSPTTGIQTAFVQNGSNTEHVDFGLYQPPSEWQNLALPVDTTVDGDVFAIDVLRVINALNRYGAISLDGSPVPTTNKIDVNGDKFLTALDALLVINYINARSRSGSGESQFIASPPVQSPAPGDGEEPPEEVRDQYLGDDDEDAGSGGPSYTALLDLSPNVDVDGHSLAPDDPKRFNNPLAKSDLAIRDAVLSGF